VTPVKRTSTDIIPTETITVADPTIEAIFLSIDKGKYDLNSFDFSTISGDINKYIIELQDR
jgi:hypothetical protein